MTKTTREVLPQICAAYCLIALIFGLFAYVDWQAISGSRWLDLAVATFGVFGFIIPLLGRDLKKPKVFGVLTLLCTAHLTFCLHFLSKGFYVRPLLYAPIGVAEIFITTFALMRLGGATFDDFRESLLHRNRK